MKSTGKILSAILMTCLFIMQCDNNSPSGPDEAEDLTGTDITGTWNAILIEGMGIDTVIELISVIDESVITSYLPDTNCYSISNQPYTLSGNQIFGEGFSGVDPISWSTTYKVSDDTLTLTVTYDNGAYSIVFERYSRAVPPSDWPQEECTGLLKKQRSDQNVFSPQFE